MFFVMSDERTTQGMYFALSAYLFWGIVPIYFKWIDHVSPWEILAHRSVWALVLLICILTYTGDLKELRVSVAKLPTLFLTAMLLMVNWLVFIYAIVNQNITETSLGYFINPLVSVFLAVIFLKERLRPLQWIAATHVRCEEPKHYSCDCAPGRGDGRGDRRRVCTED